MPRIHPTAIVDDRVEMAEDVEIGPYSILEGRMKLGSGTRIRSHAFMQGPLVMGESNQVWPFACIGTAPQTSHFDPDAEGPGTSSAAPCSPAWTWHFHLGSARC